MWAHTDHKITFPCGLVPVKTSLKCKEKSFEDFEISKILPLWGSLRWGLKQAPRPPAFTNIVRATGIWFLKNRTRTNK